ncbi:MAG: glycosyltransferase [Verrucomicrobiota bacterium]
METGYDLMTIVKVAAHWKSEGSFPIQIHFAGAGSQSKKLKNFAARKGLLDQDASQLENEHLLQPNQFSQHPITGLEENREPQKRRAGSVKELPRVVFHGYLQQEAINTLLSFADIAIVPNRPESLVAVPYKAAEYAASGLPMISCLGGEFGELLAKFRAGSEYKEGNVESLRAAFRQYIEDPKLISEQSDGAFALAKELFDRKITYPSLVNFIAD